MEEFNGSAITAVRCRSYSEKKIDQVSRKDNLSNVAAQITVSMITHFPALKDVSENQFIRFQSDLSKILTQTCQIKKI